MGSIDKFSLHSLDDGNKLVDSNVEIDEEGSEIENNGSIMVKNNLYSNSMDIYKGRMKKRNI